MVKIIIIINQTSRRPEGCVGSPNFRGSTSKSLLLSSCGERGVAGDPPKKGRKGSMSQLAVAKCEIYQPGSIPPFIPAKTCHQLPSGNGKTTQVKEKLSIKIFQRVSLASLVSRGVVGVGFLGWFWAQGAASGRAGAGAVLQDPRLKIGRSCSLSWRRSDQCSGCCSAPRCW